MKLSPEPDWLITAEGEDEETVGKELIPKRCGKACQFSSSSSAKKSERERVCNPFDSPHDGCWRRVAPLVKSYAAASLALSHLQLPDSTGIDLGQLVWGSSLPWFTRWKRDSGNLLSSYKMIAYVPEQDRSSWERPVVKALNWKQERYPVCKSITTIQCQADQRRCFHSFKEACTSGIACKHANSLGKCCIPHGIPVYRSKLFEKSASKLHRHGRVLRRKPSKREETWRRNSLGETRQESFLTPSLLKTEVSAVCV